MSDLIDREEALTALRDTLKSGGKSKGLRPVTFEMIWAIKSLPSAEPEIIRCKDCKNYYPDEDGRGYHCERDSNVRFSVHKDFYCADAERRIDE